MKVTIRDVAREANVSVATASMALNNRRGVNAHTRERVLQAAEQLSYVPNDSARSLVTSDSRTIGILVPEIVNPYYSAIVDIMTRLSEEMGYTLLLGISNNKSKNEKDYILSFISRRVLGVIVIPMLREQKNPENMNLLRAANIPVVFCTETYPDSKETCVMCDFELGEYEMTRYLLEKGLKRICFVSADVNLNFARLRLNGYIKAMEEFGFPVKKECIFLPEEPRFQKAYEWTDRVLEKNPDAIVCINDMMTIGIMKRLNELGIRVPEDISVAGFDDMMFAELAQKPMTTVRQPLDEICRKTMEFLEKSMKRNTVERGSGKQKIVLIKPELVIRSTTF